MSHAIETDFQMGGASPHVKSSTNLVMAAALKKIIPLP